VRSPRDHCDQSRLRVPAHPGQRRHDPHDGNAVAPADATFRLPRAALPLLAATEVADQVLADAGVTLEGDPKVLARLTAVLEAPDPDFAIVTP
jgi:alkyl sulfatase BDS1-like metallo-beta-lactamase superfamily hydrolase